MAYKKFYYTGNGKYKPEMCELVPEMYREGESDSEVAFKLDISSAVFYAWIKKYQEFAEAVEKGKTVSQAVRQKIGRDGAQGKIPIQARVFIANMKNRFGWRENISIESNPEVQKSIEDLKNAVSAIKAQEKDY
jgi:transposase-like protein